MLLQQVRISLTALMFGISAAAAAQAGADDWRTVSRTELCVTSGTIEKSNGARMRVDVPEMRAVATVATAPSAEIRFHYGGPTNQKSHLGSGQVRRQFGLKLRAQDPCNLVYVMWRVEQESKLVVAVKRNPSQHTSVECHNHGYINIKPQTSASLPVLKPGEGHTLRAEMKGAELRVYVDNQEVWAGAVGADAASLEGPVGIRSDNAELEFEYLARRPAGGSSALALGCKEGDID